MRKKTDARRQAILNAANALFRARGFERTSMAEINATAGGSKTTLYNYFASKEELFVECMFQVTEPYLADTLSSLRDLEMDLETNLTLLAERALRLMYKTEQLAVRRLMLTEAERAGIGKLFFENKIHVRHQEIAEYLAKAMDAGKLRRDDPLLVAIQFRALLEAEVFEPCILGATATPLEDDLLKSVAGRAVATFLRAYAPDSSAHHEASSDQRTG